MKFKKLISIFAAVMIILPAFGCAKMMAPNAQQIAENTTVEKIGSFPDNYQELVKDFVGHSLLDPYSAHYDFRGAPKSGFLAVPLSGVYYGWVGFVDINAKNRYGAYVGAHKYGYVISNNKILWCNEDPGEKIARNLR